MRDHSDTYGDEADLVERPEQLVEHEFDAEREDDDALVDASAPGGSRSVPMDYQGKRFAILTHNDRRTIARPRKNAVSKALGTPKKGSTHRDFTDKDYERVVKNLHKNVIYTRIIYTRMVFTQEC